MEQISTFTGAGWLSAAIWVPIITGVLLLLIGNDQRAGMVRVVALLGALLGAGLYHKILRPLHPAA